MLFEKPIPGLTAIGSTFLGEFGFSGLISKSLCCVESRVPMILRCVSIYSLQLKRARRTIQLSWAIFGQKPNMFLSFSPGHPD